MLTSPKAAPLLAAALLAACGGGSDSGTPLSTKPSVSAVTPDRLS